MAQGPEAPIESLPAAEAFLCKRDHALATLIASRRERWPSALREDPIWGLVRIVMAQQMSTSLACRLVREVELAHPGITSRSAAVMPEADFFRGLGLPLTRAKCCASILQGASDIRAKIERGSTWEEAIVHIKGIGPWTISVFRIMVLREPDVLPLGDVGLERAVKNVYGAGADVRKLSENWRPYRSVACWYLWRTLGNEQLG